MFLEKKLRKDSDYISAEYDYFLQMSSQDNPILKLLSLCA